MEHMLAEQGLCLTYLCNPQVDEFDQDRILEDLSEDAASDPLQYLPRCFLADYDHLVLVTKRSSGRYVAFLAADDGATSCEDFLLLKTAFVVPSARGHNLMQRMIALAVLRIGGIRSLPSAIVACTRDPIFHRIMRNTARRITQATFYPDTDSVVVNFHAAALARRVAQVIQPDQRFLEMTGTTAGPAHRPWVKPANRMMAVLDLRGGAEAVIFDDARRIYRSR